MKKAHKIILAAVLVLSLVAGCGIVFGKSSSPKEITFWHYFTSVNGETLQKFVDEYNKQQKEVHIKLEFLPRNELLKQLTIGLVSGQLPDMVFVDNPDHASFSAMGLFADLTDRVNAWKDGKFLEGTINSAKYNGRIYGLPHASNTLALYYDKDMLKEAGVTPPTTWEELKTAAAKLTKGSRKGLAFSAIKSEEGTFQMLPFFLSAGANIDNLNSPEGIKALTFVTDLVNAGYVSKEVLNWVQSDVEKQFVSGNAAMIINGPWIKPNLEKNAPDKNWGVTKIPADKVYASTLGGENIAVISKSKNIDECWDFLKWFLSKENNIKFCKEVGRFSPRSDVTPEEVWAGDEIMQVFADQMQYAQPRGPHPKWPEISDAIINAVQESITGVKKPAEALANAQAKIDAINASLK